MKLSRLVPSAGKKQMLPQLWHLWGSDVALFGLPVDVSAAIDEGPTPLPTSPVLVLDGHSAMHALCWTKRCVIVVMKCCLQLEGVVWEGQEFVMGDEILA